MKTVIFDWKQTLYNPDEKRLIDGAIDILSFLKDKDIYLAVIGKGGSDMYDEAERLGIKNYFGHIAFREGAKDVSLFEEIIDIAGAEQTIFVGDRVRSELEVGNLLGCKTIWVRQGKFADEEPENKAQEPTYIVSSLKEALDLIKNQLIA